MKILAVSDTQLGAGKSLADDRLADQEQVLNAAADLAHERDVDVVLHLGDVFEHRHPGEEERLVFKRWAAKIAGALQYDSETEYQRRLIILAGNHDLSNTALASAVDLYDRCEFIRAPRVLDLGGCSLACLPWAPIHSLVAGRESTERAGANAQAAEALVAIARGLRAECPAGKPALLAAHWSISGASLPSGLPVDDLGEVVVPQAILSLFDLTVAGHIHQRGAFGDLGEAFYCGSPYPNNFGELGTHGCYLVDTETTDWEFVEIPSRRLVTIDCDLTSEASRADMTLMPGDETDVLRASIIEHYPLTDATIRLRYTATEEQHRRVDIPAIRRLLADAGAHKLYAVEPTIIRAGRERVKGLDETASPAAALDAWCEAQGVPQGQREGLHALLEKWSG